jgi:L-threonylcarbamoyladenylate synthase
MTDQIQQAAKHIKQGGVIAYPTEGVYGLGCDPSNHTACNRLRRLKSRPLSQGLIVIAAKWAHVSPWVGACDTTIIERCLANWPGPITWLLPASKRAPYTITGDSDKIAIRLTAHTQARQLCQALEAAITSTSANNRGEPALTTYQAVKSYYQSQLDYIIKGQTGLLQGPTPIWDALSNTPIRQ